MDVMEHRTPDALRKAVAGDLGQFSPHTRMWAGLANLYGVMGDFCLRAILSKSAQNPTQGCSVERNTQDIILRIAP
ncbi:UNVERIFIED_CONTAM: hypothetical protein K2H54_031664 [Gekko kuhli]